VTPESPIPGIAENNLPPAHNRSINLKNALNDDQSQPATSRALSALGVLNRHPREQEKQHQIQAARPGNKKIKNKYFSTLAD
jgi:hypothetical protein